MTRNRIPRMRQAVADVATVSAALVPGGSGSIRVHPCKSVAASLQGVNAAMCTGWRRALALRFKAVMGSGALAPEVLAP